MQVIFASFKQKLNKQILDYLRKTNGKGVITILYVILLVTLVLFSLDILNIQLTSKIILWDLVLLVVSSIFLPQK